MTIRNQLAVAFFVSLSALAVVCFTYQQSLERLLEARKWVEHTQTVLERLEYSFSLLKDIETCQRGYGLTRNEDFLAPYKKALRQVPLSVSQIKELTVDNMNQQKRIVKLDQLMQEKIDFSEKVVELIKAGDHQTAANLTGTQQGKKIMEEVRSMINEMEEEERTLMLERTNEADRLMNFSNFICSAGASLAGIVTIFAGFLSISNFSKSVRTLQESLDEIGKGNLEFRTSINSKDEFSKLGKSFNEMAKKLQISHEESTNQAWLNSKLADLSQMLQSENSLQKAAEKILSEFASNLGTNHGMFYVKEAMAEEPYLSLLSSYAHHERKNLANKFAFGQGLVGQSALERQKIIVSNAPDDFIKISSGTGEAFPSQIVIVPLVFNDEVLAVIEQATFHPLTAVQMKYLDQAAPNLAIMLDSIIAAQNTEELLRKEQVLTEELQSQQEELTENNKRLEELTSSLQASEEELRQQQEELQLTNEELEERTNIQAQQNEELEEKNLQLEDLRISMQEKAQQLSITSKYKSQFLSNMSHELRTPLNSLLILSKALFENMEGNLNDKQVEFARTIHSAGSDLLILIDDVLDISKIEAGAMSIEIQEESIKNLCQNLKSNFEALALEKGLTFQIQIQKECPQTIETDGRRLLQILRNLISNSIKFTEQGTVTLNVELSQMGWSRKNKVLNSAPSVLALKVSDTGIGIPKEKQNVVFEAFQQADGTTNRKFGGSGLGLAISRELVRLLGGEIKLESMPGEGTTFTIFLPTSARASDDSDEDTIETLSEQQTQISTEEPLIDDRSTISAGDRVLLLVIDESELAEQLVNLAKTKDFKILRAAKGRLAFELVRNYRPDAIVLDVTLPNKEGWIFFDRLKRNISTRHIPVHVVSNEDLGSQVKRRGAMGYLSKSASFKEIESMLDSLKYFVSTKERHLLIVEDNLVEREDMEKLLDGKDIEIDSVSTGKEALELLSNKKFDCMILDLGLPDTSGFDLLRKIEEDPRYSELPVIVHTSRSLTTEEENELKAGSSSIIVKGKKSAERLLDETMLFLHRIESNLPDHKKKLLEKLYLSDPLLSGKKVLIADDDMRHIFAVTSLLENYDMKIKYAENGKQALEILNTESDINLVLMDVMMPEMDGYEAMQAIRQLDEYKDIPIIALTAKAMKGDREQCIAAGASDYLSKPVDSDQLLSLMRVWLY